MDGEILYTMFWFGINFVLAVIFIIVGLILFCIAIGAVADLVNRFSTRIHPRIVETIKCEECEIIGPEYTSSCVTEAEYSRTDERDCSICLGSMEMHDIERLRCGHMYHRECLSIWMVLKNQCPTCRSKGCCVRII